MHGCAAAPVCSGSLLAGLSFDGSHIVILPVLSCENILTSLRRIACDCSINSAQLVVCRIRSNDRKPVSGNQFGLLGALLMDTKDPRRSLLRCLVHFVFLRSAVVSVTTCCSAQFPSARTSQRIPSIYLDLQSGNDSRCAELAFRLRVHTGDL